MFILISNINLKVKNNKPINKSDINRYLEYVCIKATDDSTDAEYEFEKSIKKCSNVHCNIYKNRIKCYINCISYEKSLEIAQKILKLDTLSFLEYKFEVNSLELKELQKINTDDIIDNFGTY